MKKIIDRFGLIFLMMLVITFSLIIGANEKGFKIILMLILFLLELVYLIFKKVFYKENVLIKNKFDIITLIFFLTPIMPLIFKTYISLQGTIEFIFKYIFIYSTYLCVRNTIKTKEQTNKLLYVVLFSSFIILFIAIDMLNFRFLNNFYNYININYSNVKYLSGSFGYKNTYAIYFFLCLFISIYLFNNTKNKKKKAFLIIYSFIALLSIIFSKSRFVIVISFFSLLLYFVIIYNKKISRYLKKIILFLTIIIVLISSFFYLFFNKPDSVYIKNKTFELNYNFESYKIYNFTFYSKTKTEYHILFEETLKDLNKKRKIYIGRPSKEKNYYKYTIKYKTNKNPYRLKMIFRNEKNSKIYNFKINDEEYILKYKYIPYKISYYISSFKIKDYTIFQRLVFWNDSVKIFKKSPIIGSGGDSWRIGSRIVQEFDYKSKATHSYLFELLISCGIIGTIIFMYFWLLFNKYVINHLKNDNNYLPLLIGIDIVIIHSLFFDFNLSFMIIYLLIMIIMGILINNIKIKKIKKYNNLIDYSFILMISLITLFLSIDLIYRKYDYSLFDRNYKLKYINNLITAKSKSSEINKNIKKYIKTEPYFYKDFLYDIYLKNINLNKITQEKLIIELKFINDDLSKNIYLNRFDYNKRINYISIISNFYNKITVKNYNNKELLKEISLLKEIIYKDFSLFCKDLDNDSRTDNTIKYKYFIKYKNIISNLK